MMVSQKILGKNKLCIDPMSFMSDLYDFRMSFFYNVNTEEFFLFVQNFNMNLAVSGMLGTGAKIQSLFTLVRGEALRQFYLLYADV